ncbi:MAG: hypothetical protein COV75_07685 [Candidatus Omnitrophica bacterium CG11_big_fil_rev_8_21_14_0_20_63_9]|nr:MAG: hypothetical protein COV75_07685 [Candidatus Omnitrophica bacterium CG11_big_fil_rev_8_21_14_0_20_63_9]
MWSAVAIRCFVFPYDLHGDYPAPIHALNMGIDFVLIMPPWLILQHVITPPETPWAFWSLTALYLFALSGFVYLAFMRKNRGGRR